MDENLMDFSINNENIEDDFHPPALMQTPIVKNSILKPSNKDNLIQLHTPVHKGLKVKFQTPHSVKKSTPTRFNDIRILDEEERWTERTAVVTKQDHLQNTQYAMDILDNIINNLPLNATLPGAEASESASGENDFGTTDLDSTVVENQKAGIDTSATSSSGEILDNTVVESQKDDCSKENLDSSQNLDNTVVENKNVDTVPSSNAHSKEILDGTVEGNHGNDNIASSDVLCNKDIVQEQQLTVQEDHDVQSMECEEESSVPGPREEEDMETEDFFDAVDTQEDTLPGGTGMTQTDNCTQNTKAETLTEENKECESTVEEDCQSNTEETEKVQNIIASPPLPSSKGSYDLDFDNLDALNPFQSKSCVANSPVVSSVSKVSDIISSTVVTSSSADTEEKTIQEVQADKADSDTKEEEDKNSSLSELQNVTDNPFLQLIESPAVKESIPRGHFDEMLIEKTDNILSQSFEDIDPFKTKSNVQMSPVLPSTKIEDGLSADKVTDVEDTAPVGLSDQGGQPQEDDQSKPEAPIMKPTDQDVDLSTGSTPSESSDGVLHQMVSKEEETMNPNGPQQDAPDVADPFKPRSQIVNSPLSTTDPFKSRSQVMNSPMSVTDPFKTRSQIMNSPLSTTDPFKPSKQIMNSPNMVPQNGDTESDKDIDPFKSKLQIPNSPTTDNSVTCKEDDLPSQAQHSDGEKTATEKEKESLNSKENGHTEPNEVSSKSDIGINDKEESNPFATKSKIVNSPASAITDPFKTVSKIANSPMENPGTESKLMDDIDPFKTSTKMPNSPVVPPASDSENNLMSNESISQAADDQNVDPFQTPKAKPANATSQKEECTPSASHTSETCQVDQLQDPFKTPSRETQTASSVIPNKQGFVDPACIGLSEDDFKPATADIFSDPSAWDMLEQFGSGANTESSLSRMSLYVKFDPLVDLPPGDPRRASIDVRRASIDPRRVSMNLRRASMKPEQLNALRQLDPEESFLLMGTPPNKNSRKTVNPAQLMGKDGTPTSIDIKSNKKVQESAAPNPMDLLCSDTPEAKKSEDNTQPCSEMNVKLGDIDEEGIIDVLQYTDSDIKRIKQRLTLEFQGMLMTKERAWSKENKALKDEMEKERHQIEGWKKDVQNMTATVSEYEVIITRLLADNEKMKEELEESKEKKDQADEDFQSIETSFSDLMKRYEKLKTALQVSKKNEEIWKKSIEDHEANVKKAENKVNILKQAAEEKLAHANQEIQKLRSSTEGEIAKLQAELKRKEVQLEGVKNSMEQKTKENKELTELCDQLIAKVGS